MKLNHPFLTITFLLVFLLNFNQLKAQNNLDGKTFIGLTSESCKSKIDGGCWIVTHTVFAFTSDSVSISYNVKGNCSPASTMYDKENAWLKTYSWKEKEGFILIDQYKAHDNLQVLSEHLIDYDLRYDNPKSVKFDIEEENDN